MSSPTVALSRPERRLRAMSLRRKPSSAIAVRTRSTSACATAGSLLTTRETVLRLTPARRATSTMVGRRGVAEFVPVPGIRRPSHPAVITPRTRYPLVPLVTPPESAVQRALPHRPPRRAPRGTGNGLPSRGIRAGCADLTSGGCQPFPRGPDLPGPARDEPGQQHDPPWRPFIAVDTGEEQ